MSDDIKDCPHGTRGVNPQDDCDKCVRAELTELRAIRDDLAARSPVTSGDEANCGLCGGYSYRDTNEDAEIDGYYHSPSCPWRRAIESKERA